MLETSVKTHLIIKDIQEEYFVKWTGNIINTNPLIENGRPVFIIYGKEGYIEINSGDMKYIEEMAKYMTAPKGRQSFTSDKAYIYIKEKDGNKKLMGTLIHNRIKQYGQMYDTVGYREY